MEDSSLMWLLDSNTRVDAVFDGHGGEEVADFVKMSLMRQFQSLLSCPSPEQIAQGFVQTDRELQTHGQELLACARNPRKKRASAQMLEMRRDNPEMTVEEMHSTILASTTGAVASVAFVNGDVVTVATLGDCQALIARRNAEGNLVAVDLQRRTHRLSDPEESSRVRVAGLEVSGNPLRIENNLAVSRAFGDLQYKSQQQDGLLLPPSLQPVSVVPEILEVDTTEDDVYIFLGCDGIFEVMTPQQIVDHLGDAPDDLCSLLDACLAPAAEDAFGKDNMTAVLAYLKPIPE